MRRFQIAAVAALALASASLATAQEAVYVSATGNDGQSGLTPATPVFTIPRALQIATGAARTKVHVAGGVYPGFTMANGIDVIGGFDPQFVPSSTVTTTILAPNTLYNGQDVTIVAQGITLPTRLAGLVLQQRSTATNRNTIGLFIRDSSSALIVENLRINGTSVVGTAATGAAGASAVQTTAAGGAAGISAHSVSLCNMEISAGGTGGSSNGTSGGKGGAGGPAYTSCNPFPNQIAAPGQAGLAAYGGGHGGAGTPANSTLVAGIGGHGTSQNGSSAGPGSIALLMNGGNPLRMAGASGMLGTQGTAGGGGGGGGGVNMLAKGAGGGGGGAGGQRAPSAGQGGAAGANSIGILILNSNPTIRNSAITRGNGSAGGRGGAGGAGQPGGPGGAGGAGYQKIGSSNYYGRGGAGGNGGRGGHSGAGAGGPGGHSIGILRNSASAPMVSGLSYSGGAGGAGGLGGTAPHQAAANGLPGGVHDVLVAN